jgi:adenylate cyclase class 2
MLEIEMKFPVADFSLLERVLQQCGAKPKTSIHETDHYFNAPDRDFGRTDEALRVRRIGQANYLTYKGPRRDAQTKTRSEIEVGLAEGDAAASDLMRLLESLGYRPVAVVRKHRKIFQLDRDSYAVEICLDRVEGLGAFAEVEIIASEEHLDEARTVLLRLAGELGLSQSERRSYLELLLARRGEKPV